MHRKNRTIEPPLVNMPEVPLSRAKQPTLNLQGIKTASARTKKNSAANFCKFFAIDEAKVTLAALIQRKRFQNNFTIEGKMNSKIKAGRKYRTANGYAVEIDCLNSHEGARNPDGEASVLGRIFYQTLGWQQATWNLHGKARADGQPSEFEGLWDADSVEACIKNCSFEKIAK